MDVGLAGYQPQVPSGSASSARDWLTPPQVHGPGLPVLGEQRAEEPPTPSVFDLPAPPSSVAELQAELMPAPPSSSLPAPPLPAPPLRRLDKETVPPVDKEPVAAPGPAAQLPELK